MPEGNRNHPVRTFLARHSCGELQKALSAHKVGLEARTERIAAPGDSGSFAAAATQQGVIENYTIGRTGG
jgi:hypothetical protein